MSTKNLVLISVLSVIVFVLEQALIFLPNITLTVFLMILYSKCLNIKNNLWIIFIYVMLDNLFMGTMNLIFLIFIYLGWSIIPITLNTIFKNINSSITLACLSLLYSLLYCLSYVIPTVLIYHIDPVVYLMNDVVFEIILMISSFVSVLWLYEPCCKVLKRYVTD